MTVRAVESSSEQENTHIECRWFSDRDERLRNGSFEPEELIHVEVEEGNEGLGINILPPEEEGEVRDSS